MSHVLADIQTRYEERERRAAVRPLLRSPQFRINEIRNFGVSLAVGQSALGNHGYSKRLASMLNATHNQFAAGSSKMMHDIASTNGGWSRVLQNITATQKAQNARPYAPWPVGTNQLVLLHGGQADLYKVASGGDNDDARVTIPRVVEAMRVMISRALAAYIVEDQNLSFSTTPAWSVGAVTTTESNSGSRYTAAATANTGCYCEWTTPTLPPGAVVCIGGLAAASEGATVTFTRGATQLAQLLTANIRPTTASKINGWVRRFKVEEGGAIEPFTATTIRTTWTSLSGTFPPRVDYAQVESPLAPAESLVLVLNSAKFYSNSVLFGANLADRDAIFDEYNAALADLAAEFQPSNPFLPNPVQIVDVDSVIDKRLDYHDPYADGSAGDGIHWNDDGHAAVAEACYEKVIDWYASRLDIDEIMRSA